MKNNEDIIDKQRYRSLKFYDFKIIYNYFFGKQSLR